MVARDCRAVQNIVKKMQVNGELAAWVDVFDSCSFLVASS